MPISRDKFCWHPKCTVFAGTSPVVVMPQQPLKIGHIRQISSSDTARAVGEIRASIEATAPFRIAKTAADVPWQPKIGDQAVFECMTSGTTGAPKSIQRSHASWIASMAVNADIFDITPVDSYAVFGDLGHSLALYGVIEAATLGADIHLLGGLHPNRQMAHMQQHNVSLLYATPTQLRLLGKLRGVSLPSARYVLCGGGALDAACRADVARLFPNARLCAFYGASETSFVTLADTDTPTGSVGRAYPGVRLEVRNAAPGEIGDVWVSSPYLFTNYGIGSSADTIWQEGFLTVGELGLLDNQGNLYLAGRKSRMVGIADQNVFPEEIEAVLMTHPFAAQCAVLPMADGLRGQVLVAMIAGGEDDVLRRELLARCRAQLGPIKTPKRLVFIADMPMTPSGKPDLAALSILLAAGA